MTLFECPAPRVFTIDAEQDFLKNLAAGLLAEIGRDPFALSDTLIFLPTRRAVRAFGDRLIEMAEGRALLLPKMRALGDIDDEASLDVAISSEDEFELPPAVSRAERLTTLARLVGARDRALSGRDNWPAALAAARELERALDSFYTEEVGFDGLRKIVPEEYAAHWGLTVEFLRIVSEAWPQHLEEIGRMDTSARRVAMIRRLERKWRQSPPKGPVVLAGSTGSVPAVADLAALIARMAKGMVVLPGLDTTLDRRAWREIDSPHPQSGLKSLIETIGVEFDGVRRWPTPTADASSRARLLSLALRPAEATDDWRDLALSMQAKDPEFASAAAGLAINEAETEESEATSIAMMLRETLETPDATAMLVTSNRALARRVAAKMARWGVVVGDSAGLPLMQSDVGRYLRLVARWLQAPNDPVALLSLANCGLASFGLGVEEKGRMVDLLDRGLRGVSPVDHPTGLRNKLQRTLEEKAAQLDPLLEMLEAAAAQWRNAGAFTEALGVHVDVAESFASTDAQVGAARLWRGRDGDAAHRVLTELRSLASDAPITRYAATFDELISSAVIYDHRDAHPRLAILGPLEARLLTADLVILGGLNEGDWPSEARGDAFLSRPMREKLGLPPPERQLGLAAHDFAQLCAKPEVVLSRAKRADGAPTRPSRWLVRLMNILKGAGALPRVDRSRHRAALARRLDETPLAPAIVPPAPRPPVAVRPRELYVTAIENWLRDPYSIYARYILGLKKLDDPGAAFAVRDLGALLHKVFECAAKQDACATVGELWRLLDLHAPEFGLSAVDKRLFESRLDAAFRWFERFDGNQRLLGRTLVVEGVGEATFPAPAGAFTLRARADRIDCAADRSVTIFDYKTGKPPTLAQQSKFSPQLPLTALIALRGGFAGTPATEDVSFEYLRILNRKNDGADDVGAKAAAAANLIREAEEGLAELVAMFDNPDTPYLSQPRPEFRNDYGDYDQLARRGEWTVVGGEDDE